MTGYPGRLHVLPEGGCRCLSTVKEIACWIGVLCIAVALAPFCPELRARL